MTLLTKTQISAWLQWLNTRLQLAGRKLITQEQITAFTELLVENGYTKEMALCAQVFIPLGKRTDYTRSEWHILSEMFWPTADQMKQFSMSFIPVAQYDAQLRERDRQIALERDEFEKKMQLGDSRLREMYSEIKRLRREPITPIQLSDEHKTMCNNLQTYLNSPISKIQIENKQLKEQIRQQKREIQQLTNALAGKLTLLTKKVSVQASDENGRKNRTIELNALLPTL